MEENKEINENAGKKKKSPLFWLIFWAGFAVLMLLLDIISKWCVQNSLKIEGTSVELIPNFLYVTLSHNTGVAFGLGSGTTWGRVLNIIISIVMSAFFIFYLIYSYKKSSTFLKAILALLAAGGVGNLIDRLFYWDNTVGFNGVIDWIQIYLGGGPDAPQSVVNPFASFNLADSCLTIGVILFIVLLIVDSVRENKEKKEEEGKPHVVESDDSMHKEE